MGWWWGGGEAEAASKRKWFYMLVNTAVFICKAVLRALIPDLLVTSEKRAVPGC